MQDPISTKLFNRILVILYAVLFVWSAIHPKDYSVWLLEIAGVLFMIGVYLFFLQYFKFSKLTNLWFFIGVSLITIGAHYSFPNVPLLDLPFELFQKNRNNFDKLGHLVQGIVPVLIAWDVLVKLNVLSSRLWISLFSFCVAISISAMYELVEWLFIVVLGDNAYTFDVLGTQGYVWDAQSDMLCALIGALIIIVSCQNHLKQLLTQP